MTIILAIPTKDGVIIASDGQITSGLIRTTGKKIKKLNKRCLWGASGEMALIQRVEETISYIPNKEEQSLQNLRDILSKTIRECVDSFLKLVGDRPVTGDFLFVEYVLQPHILHIALDGTPEWIVDRPFVSGIRPEVATALFHKYLNIIPDRIDTQKGTFLAFKIIEEVIEVISYGVGPPIDIWQITKEGVKNLDEREISALEDLSRGLREAEIEIFLRKSE